MAPRQTWYALGAALKSLGFVVLALAALESADGCTKTEPSVACVPAGGDLGGGRPIPGSVSPSCCPGLQPRWGRVLGTDVPPSMNPQGEECYGDLFTPYFCVACGDGICGPGENFCRCPEDCAQPDGGFDAGDGSLPCMSEDAGIASVRDSLPCCAGLVTRLNLVPVATPAGTECKLPSDAKVCIKCGDGVCGPYENFCICPADCP
jgi:hypothetical protein